MLDKTKHPCAGMTKAQRWAFEAIAISQSPHMHPKTTKVLLDRGVIQRDADEVVGRDNFGPINVARYSVPIHVHHQWCKWCSENVGGNA
jgi:hypothetical protein